MNEFKSVFRNRSLLILGIAESVSNTGNWITMMAVFAMIVFKGQGGVVESSGVFLAGLLPTLFFSPLAGWLCDRIDRKKLMIASELISGLVILGLVFTDQLVLIYTILALQAFSITIMTPARQSAVPQLVQQDELTRANAFLQQLAGLIKIIAPILAGGLLAVISPHQAILLDVISFGLSALILTRLPALRPAIKIDQGETVAPPAQPTAAHLAASDGQPEPKLDKLLPALKGSAQLQILFILTFLTISVFVGFDVLAPVYFRDVLNVSETFFGQSIGLVGLGTLISSLMLMLRKGNGRPWVDVLAGVLLLGLIPVAMAAATLPSLQAQSRGLILAASLVGGVGNGLIIVQVGTLLQLLSPAVLLGRMGGIFQSTAVGGQLAGILLTPLLVPDRLSMGAYFGLASIALLLVMAGAALVLARTGSSLSERPLAEGVSHGN